MEQVAQLRNKMIAQRCRHAADWVRMLAQDALRGEHRAIISLPHEIYENAVVNRYAIEFFRKRAEKGDLDSVESMIHSNEGLAQLQETIRDELWDWWQKNHGLNEEYVHAPQAHRPSDEGVDMLLWQYERAARKSGDIKKIDTFARVRNARYVDVDASNIDALLPKIGQSYKRAWLKPETLEKLKTNHPDDIDHFRKTVERGVFVYDWNERNGGPSLEEQFREDVLREVDTYDTAKFRCKCLLDDEGEILAWLSYLQPPKSSRPEAYRERVRDYMLHGATGGRMEYTRKPNYKQFRHRLDNIFLFDTLRGGVPMAASRLFAKSMQEVAMECSHIQHFICYRLHEIFITPQFEAMREPLRFSENIRSEHFFHERGCKVIAYDYNKNGPKSPRTLSDESVIQLNPNWVVLAGEMPDVFHRSLNEWRLTQIRYGDFSSDGINPAQVYRNTPFKLAIPEDDEDHFMGAGGKA